MANLDWSQCDAVESVPGKVSGAWVFKGTRMPVQTVFANLEAGMSVKEISYTLGFRTTSHFVASFHREFGAPPAKYRANGGDNDSLC